MLQDNTNERAIHDALHCIARHGRPDYATWFQLCSGLTSELGAGQAADILLRVFPDEHNGETLYKCKRSARNIGIGTVFHLAKGYGFEFRPEHFDDNRGGAITYRAALPEPPKRLVAKTQWGEPLTRSILLENIPERFRIEFYDLFERAGIAHNDATALEEYRQKHGLPETERLFRVSVNRTYHNKPDTETTRRYYADFRNETLSGLELLDAVLSGATFAPSQYAGRKHSENWLHAELAVVDCDDGLTLAAALAADRTTQALFVYTTASHGKGGKDRFRVVFGLPAPLYTKQAFTTFTEHLCKEYSGDSQAANLTQAWAGNDAAMYWLINPFG